VETLSITTACVQSSVSGKRYNSLISITVHIHKTAVTTSVICQSVQPVTPPLSPPQS